MDFTEFWNYFSVHIYYFRIIIEIIWTIIISIIMSARNYADHTMIFLIIRQLLLIWNLNLIKFLAHSDMPIIIRFAYNRNIAPTSFST